MKLAKIKQIIKRNRHLVDFGIEGYDYENLVLLCEKVSIETEKEQLEFIKSELKKRYPKMDFKEA